MIVIAGLGNPEREYKGTRHNIGFETINKFAYDNAVDINKLKFRAHIGEGHLFGEKIMLLKPQTYMNLSGEAIRDALEFYKLSPENLIVVCDDVNLDLGEIRIRKSGSAGGQNGLKNIIYHLETDEFIRIRIGVGEKPPKMDLADFVLSHFKKDETDKMIEGITKAAEGIEIILKDGIQSAMNKLNKKKPAPKKEQEDPGTPEITDVQ